MTVKEQLKQRALIELARREFIYYCRATAGDFYKSDREYLTELAEGLQDFYYSADDVLVVNLPPRHGKSRTASLFVEWVFGKDKKPKVMTASYNEMLSTSFSRAVRNNIQQGKADDNIVVFSDIFPDVRIKDGESSVSLWSLDGGHNNYLATSPAGTSTGFGANLILIDDLIKNAEEAHNANVLNKHWDWFTNTMLSRLEEKGKIIIIMTRWSTSDLAGKALAHFQNEGKKIRHLTMKAVQEDGTMLCEEILSKESYDMKTRAMGLDIASANYQQEPIDVRGTLYKGLKTYHKLDFEFESINNYTDTADQGKDYLCSITYGAYMGEAYILDVIYTKEGMEITEPMTAEHLHRNDAKLAEIESNSGGRGFARNVQKILWEKYGTRKPLCKWFHQSKNKLARILSASTFVMNNIYFPHNWKSRFPEFYQAVVTFQKEGKNTNDDAPDGLSGVAEFFTKKRKVESISKSKLGL